MNILHYSLGFPPYRSGGLTKFCIDLMEKQSEYGHKVSMLWPGEIKLLNKRIYITPKKSQMVSNYSISNYEIINPLPVSYDEGVYNTKEFMKKGSENVFREFLLQLKPDVIHIHTFMGLHREFLEIAKELKIQTVFTTHDFFSMCPKVTLFRDNQICSSMLSCAECNLCNSSALSKNKIFLLQSPLYRKLKNNTLVRYFRRKHRNSYFESQIDENRDENKNGEKKDYVNLRNYYYSMLRLIDCIHYNSTISKYVYEKIFSNLPKGIVYPISHSGIKDNRKIKKFSDNELKIRFLGQPSGAKGFFILKSALDRLYKESNINFKLFLHYVPSQLEEYMVIEESFSSNELGVIFDNTDILVAPSIWYETFGFTVLEALSYGVPVIVSDSVGAKDIIAEGCGIVINKINAEKLKNILLNLRSENLEMMNEKILNNQRIITLDEVNGELIRKYYIKGWKHD